MVEGWVQMFTDWTASCYPMPADRIIKTSDKICHHGITYRQLKDGLEGAEDMWNKFLLPLLEAYKEHPSYDKETYDQAYKILIDSVYRTGSPHSYRCEFIWILTRVRYFEIIPTWEIERVRDDANSYFEGILEFRHTLVTEHKVEAKGIYSVQKLDEMKAKKARIVEFLDNWSRADPKVFDKDGELHRRVIRSHTFDLSKEANEIYYWYFNMAFKQFKWKEGRPHDYVSSNYLWSDDTCRFVRNHAL